jgi:DNA-binding response OmpR family regulator
MLILLSLREDLHKSQHFLSTHFSIGHRWVVPMSSVDVMNRRSEVQALKGVDVLVVEDSWQVAQALRAALEVFGMVVLGPVATTADAMKLVERQAPELAVVDINLKGEKAYALIEWLGERRIGVLVGTGYVLPPGSVDKAAAILQKPYSGPELLDALVKALRRTDT